MKFKLFVWNPNSSTTFLFTYNFFKKIIPSFLKSHMYSEKPMNYLNESFFFNKLTIKSIITMLRKIHKILYWPM